MSDSFRILGLVLKDMTLDKKRLGGQHLVVKCLLLDQEKAISSPALIDCGATEFAFVIENFACLHKFPLLNLKISCSLEVIDGRLIESGDIM